MADRPPAEGDPPSGPGGGTPPPYGGYPGQQQPGGYYPPPPPPPPPPPYGGYPGQQPGGTFAPPPTPYGAYPGSGWDGGQAPPGSGGWSRLAIAAFVCSFVPWLGILAAVPLAIAALFRVGRLRQRGRGLAIAAIIISVLWWVASIALVVIFAGDTAERSDQGEITKEGIIDFGDVRAGDCVDIDDLGSDKEVGGTDLQGVPCDQSHNAQLVGDVPVTGDSYPGFSDMIGQAAVPCRSLVSDFVDPSLITAPAAYLIAPTEDLWKSDDDAHRVLCFVVQSGYSDMTGSVAK